MRVELPEAKVMKAMSDADAAGVRLEVHQGLPIWEFHPSPLHVIECERISQSIRESLTNSRGCGCHRYQDMSIRFPDGSVRRPDIAVFCTQPEPTQEATTLIPGAVIEVVSPGSEIKDLELSPSFYLSHGVLDVVVFDPRTGNVLHFRKDGRTIQQTPVAIELESGCQATD
jgi:Uma2 family endonuclease